MGRPSNLRPARLPPPHCRPEVRPCFGWRKKLADNLTKREKADRLRINMHETWEVKYWTKHLDVTKEQLQKAVDKVGNSAPAVRKELGKD